MNSTHGIDVMIVLVLSMQRVYYANTHLVEGLFFISKHRLSGSQSSLSAKSASKKLPRDGRRMVSAKGWNTSTRFEPILTSLRETGLYIVAKFCHSTHRKHACR